MGKRVLVKKSSVSLNLGLFSFLIQKEKVLSNDILFCIML